MKKILLMGIALFHSFISVANKPIIVNGYVVENSSKEYLNSITITDSSKTFVVNSNEYGFFSFELEHSKKHADKKTKLYFFRDGYETVIIDTVFSADATLNIVMNKLQFRQADSLNNRRVNKNQNYLLSGESIRKGANYALEPDFSKALQMLPGVKFSQSGRINDAGFNVRGGTRGDNYYLLDGAPIYYPFHQYFGIFGWEVSGLNMDAVQSINFQKNGIDAASAGRSASVLDFRLREGDMQKTKGDLTLGTVSYRATFEGPIVKNKSSYLLSFRKSYLPDIAGSSLSTLTSGAISATSSLYDFTAKTNYIINEKNRLYLGFYSGKTNAGLVVNVNDTAASALHFKTDGILRNLMTSLRWNQQFNNKLFANHSAIFSRYATADVPFEISITSPTGSTVINTQVNTSFDSYILKSDFNYAMSNQHQFKLGANYSLHHGHGNFSLDVNYAGKSEKVNFNIDEYLHEIRMYVQDDWTISKEMKLNAGVNLASAITSKKSYFFPEPHLSLFYALSPNSLVKVSSEVSQQYCSVTQQNIVMATDSIAPQTTWHSNIGYQEKIISGRKTFVFNVDAYYKKMNNILSYAIATNEPVSGQAYGLETMIQANGPKLRTSLSYNLSWSTVNDRNRSPQTILSDYDKRHTASFSLLYFINEKISMSANTLFSTGSPYTVFNYKYAAPTPDGNYIVAYQPSVINQATYPSYTGIDMGISFTKKKKLGIQTWSYKLYITNLKGMTPSLMYNIKF